MLFTIWLMESPTGQEAVKGYEEKPDTPR